MMPNIDSSKKAHKAHHYADHPSIPHTEEEQKTQKVAVKVLKEKHQSSWLEYVGVNWKKKTAEQTQREQLEHTQFLIKKTEQLLGVSLEEKYLRSLETELNTNHSFLNDYEKLLSEFSKLKQSVAHQLKHGHVLQPDELGPFNALKNQLLDPVQDEIRKAYIDMMFTNLFPSAVSVNNQQIVTDLLKMAIWGEKRGAETPGVTQRTMSQLSQQRQDLKAGRYPLWTEQRLIQEDYQKRGNGQYWKTRWVHGGPKLAEGDRIFTHGKCEVSIAFLPQLKACKVEIHLNLSSILDESKSTHDQCNAVFAFLLNYLKERDNNRTYSPDEIKKAHESLSFLDNHQMTQLVKIAEDFSHKINLQLGKLKYRLEGIYKESDVVDITSSLLTDARFTAEAATQRLTTVKLESLITSEQFSSCLNSSDAIDVYQLFIEACEKTQVMKQSSSVDLKNLEMSKKDILETKGKFINFLEKQGHPKELIRVMDKLCGHLMAQTYL